MVSEIQQEHGGGRSEVLREAVTFELHSEEGILLDRQSRIEGTAQAKAQRDSRVHRGSPVTMALKPTLRVSSLKDHIFLILGLRGIQTL